jgi:hypothetical protein
MGYALSSVLFATVELEIVDRLADGPLSAGALAQRVSASTTGVARLCAALCALGMLHREPDGRFAAPPATIRLLSKRGEESLAPVLAYHQRHVAPLMGRLTEAVRSGRPQHAAWSFATEGAAARHAYEELALHPEEYDLFLQAMDRFGRGVGAELAATYDLSSIRRLVDFGGGSGRIARELLVAAPHLAIEMHDLPVACAMAEREAAGAGLADRFRATVADLTKPLPSSIEPADAVLVSGMLADWSEEGRSKLLANAAALLRPGGLPGAPRSSAGVLLVSETLLQEDRTGPMIATMLSLVMLAGLGGDSFTLSELRGILEGAGFLDVEHRPPREVGRRDLLIGRR